MTSTNLKYFDIHGHVNFPEYDADREEVIERAQKAGIGMILVGTDIESSKRCVELAVIHEGIWASIGIHPTHTEGVVDFSELKELAKHPKVVAIGECGLDYFRSKPEEIPAQRELFKQHIALANGVRKPLMLHIRNSLPRGDLGTNAYQEAIAMLKEHSKVRANFHFFAGSAQDMQDIIAMNNTISFTGVLTFARNYDEVVKTVPLTHMMSETDCPYVSPIPHRGKRNEPLYVIEVVKKIAEIRGKDEIEVAEQLMKNVKDFFGLIRISEVPPC